MTSKVNGQMKILTPYRSETPENIETKIGQNDYVVGPFNPASFRRNRSKVVCSPYNWNITLNCVIFYSSFFLSLATAKTSGRIFTIYNSNDAASPKDWRMCLLRVSMTKIVQVSKPHKTPQKVGVVTQFQAKRKKLNFQYIQNCKSDQYEIWQDT